MDSNLNQPLVSMLIPSFNHGRYVQSCIDSVISQDYANIELIIIDDGSKDDSVQTIERMEQACRSRFARFEIRSRPNRGLAETINEALDWCHGIYFAVIASDDCLYANKTSTLLGHLEEDERLAGVFSGCDFINADGSVIDQLNLPLTYYEFDDVIARDHAIVAASQLLRLKPLIDVGRYPIGLYIEDWYMWLALTKKGFKLKVVPERLVQNRQHETNISKNATRMFESRIWILDQYKNHPLYGLAAAKISLMAAIDFSCSSKKMSARCLIEAAAHSWQIIFTRSFMGGLVRLIAPCFLVRQLAHIKSRARKRAVRLDDHSGQARNAQ
jgi:alpha-1,3-rhamnosyltransferase